MSQDWYERRDELESGMVFRTCEGGLVKLDRPVEGDATQWHVADLWGKSWAWMDSIVEPADLVEKVEDPTAEAEFSPG